VGGVGKRKPEEVSGDAGTRGRQLRAVRDLLRRAYPPAGQAVDADARSIIETNASADFIPHLMRRNIPEDIIVEILINLLPAGFSDPYAEPIPTQRGYTDADMGAIVKRGRGRPSKLVGGYTPAQIEKAIVDMLDAKEGLLRMRGITTHKIATLKKQAIQYIQNNPRYPLTIDALAELFVSLWSEF
jgi:hypothetical protein